MSAPELDPGFSGRWSYEHQMLLADREVRSVAHLLPNRRSLGGATRITVAYTQHGSVCDQLVSKAPSLCMAARKEQWKPALGHGDARTLSGTGAAVRWSRVAHEGAAEGAPSDERAGDAGLPRAPAHRGERWPRLWPSSLGPRMSSSRPTQRGDLAQQIVHGLRTGGDMAFDRSVPSSRGWTPRSSRHRHRVRAAGPLAGVQDARDLGDRASGGSIPGEPSRPRRRPPVVLSLLRGLDVEPGTVSIETFAFEFFAAGIELRRYWDHLLGWWVGGRHRTRCSCASRTCTRISRRWSIGSRRSSISSRPRRARQGRRAVDLRVHARARGQVRRSPPAWRSR